jgi:hypothetical protein
MVHYGGSPYCASWNVSIRHCRFGPNARPTKPVPMSEPSVGTLFNALSSSVIMSLNVLAPGLFDC